MEALLSHVDYLNALRTSDDNKSYEGKNELLEDLQNQSNGILQSLKEMDDVKAYRIIVAILALTISGLILWVLLKHGYYWNILILIALAVFLVFMRSAMIKKAKGLLNHYWIKEMGASNELKNLPDKMDYIISGIELKMHRIHWAKRFYMYFFPFLMIYFSWVLKGELAFGNWILTTIMAFVIGSLIWIFAFGKDIQVLEELRSAVEALKYTIS